MQKEHTSPLAMADITDSRKSDMSTHQEYAAATPEKGLQHHADDDETAAYTTGSPIEIDKATDRRLFWKINRRVLICMLGVSYSPLRRVGY